MARHQRPLPRRQPRVDFLTQRLQAPVESLDFVGTILAARHAGELLDLLLQFAQRPFEIVFLGGHAR